MIVKYIQKPVSLKDCGRGKAHIDSFQFSEVPQVDVVPKKKIKKYLIVKVRAHYFVEIISPRKLVW